MPHKINLSIFVIFASAILFFSSCSDNTTDPVNSSLDSNKNESQTAFNYLNQIRQNPSAYSVEMGVDLSSVAPSIKLTWNALLAKVAEEKAMDMASRNYFSHQTPEGFGINYLINKAGYTLPSAWLTDPAANNFESIAAAYKGTTFIGGKDFIKQLIVDQGVPDLGHRKHLLAIGTWYASLVDCGIGLARNASSNYKNYFCVIIAKQK